LLERGGVDGGDEGADDGVEEDGEGGLITCREDGEAEAVGFKEGDAGAVVVGYAICGWLVLAI
jgi:hypothetical protein